MLVIDAYNVLHQTGVLRPALAGIELPGLAELIESSRYAGVPVLMICDGVRPGIGHSAPSATRIGRARVLYAGAGREADAEIERIIAESTAPTRLIVVSSDKRLRRAARRRRARWLRSETFLAHLDRDADRRGTDPMPKWAEEIPLPPEAVAHWLETFGLTGDGPGEDDVAGATDSGGPDAARMPEGSSHAGPPDARRDASAEHEPPAPQQRDPELERLLEEESEGIDPDDLDMNRWLGGG